MSLPALASNPTQIEQAADPAGFVVLACERAKQWLAEALEHGQIEDIVELKSQAEAIRVYTAQKQIGKDAELAAAEIVRRAERGIGVAIRRGQRAGEIALPGSLGGVPPNARGRVYTVTSKPTDYATPDELSGNQAGIYHMTDGVEDDAFEAGLADAKAERNLSRANVVRRVRRHAETGSGPTVDLNSPGGRRTRIRELAAQGYSSRQIADQIGMLAETVRRVARDMSVEISADKAIGKSRRPDSNRIVEETVYALDGLRMGLELVDFGELDRSQIAHWSSSLKTSIRSLNRFLKELDQ